MECTGCGVAFDRLNQGEFEDAKKGNVCNDCLAYEVKGVVTGIGHDLAGFKATLYCNDKKVAIVNDDGFGGCFDFHWVKPEFEEEYNKLISRIRAFEEKKGDTSKYWYQDSFIFDGEIYADDLVKLYEENNGWKKLCRKGVVFQVGDNVGSKEKYLIIKGQKYHKQTFDKFLEQKYANQEVRILNQEFGINVMEAGEQ
jgi:hypothetical protein